MDFFNELTDLIADWGVSGVIATQEGLFPHGMADRAAGRATSPEDSYPLTLDTPFVLALLCGRLADKGALSLRSPLSRWLPELSGLAGLPAIAGLLAGRPLADYWSQRLVPELEEERQFQALSPAERAIFLQRKKAEGVSPEALFPFLRETRPDPEAEPEFTLTHRVLLAEILRRASGKTLTRLAEEEIFQPLAIAPAKSPTVAGWSRFEDGPLIPQPPLALPDICCLTGTQAGALARAMAEETLVSPSMWKTLRKSPVFSGGSALTAVGSDSLYGCNITFYFLPGTGRWAVRLSNETQPLRLTDSGWLGFAYLLRQLLEARFLPYTAPKLERYSRKNWTGIYGLKLSPKQKSFVSEPSEAICEAYADRRNHPYLLIDRGKTVGMAVLHIDRKREIFRIENLLVSLPYQGRGYGKALLAQCVDKMRAAGARRVTLEAERGNAAARRLYEQTGFSIRREDEETFFMEMDLS